MLLRLDKKGVVIETGRGATYDLPERVQKGDRIQPDGAGGWRIVHKKEPYSIRMVMNTLTFDEVLAIIESTDPQVTRWGGVLERMAIFGYNLSPQKVLQLLNFLVAEGILTQDRKAEIIDELQD